MELDPVKLADHVKDAHAFELPFETELPLPNLFGLQLTKFMVLELAVALLMVLIFVPLARKIASGQPVKGRFANLFELMIMFLRNEVVRPAVGEHDAARFLPLILTLFFFIFFCNLAGLFPFLGSPTASINVTRNAGRGHVRCGRERRHEEVRTVWLLAGAMPPHGCPPGS